MTGSNILDDLKAMKQRMLASRGTVPMREAVMSVAQARQWIENGWINPHDKTLRIWLPAGPEATAFLKWLEEQKAKP